MPVFNNALAGAAGSGGADADFKIERSLRFSRDDGSYLNRTFAAGNRKTWTWSGWIKLGKEQTGGSSNRYVLFECTDNFPASGNPYGILNIVSGFLGFGEAAGGAYTTAQFRDHSAWYHIVAAMDTTQSTPADRLKLYVNGVQYAHTGYTFGLNADTAINQSGIQHNIGREENSGIFLADLLMADVHFIDGQALNCTSFGKFDADTGVWNPIEFTGNYNTAGSGTQYSTSSTMANASAVFDGNASNYGTSAMNSGSYQTVTTQPITFTLNNGTFTYNTNNCGATGGSNNRYLRLTRQSDGQTTELTENSCNGWTIPNAWTNITISKIEWKRWTSYENVSAVYVDGTMLVDSGSPAGVNGFHLDFSDNSSNAALGTDSSGNNNTWTVNNITASAGLEVTVANATGALPIVNTSGDQGGTATSGNRTDSNASNLELALPLYGNNNATQFYDNSGNNRTVNNTGTQVKTLHSRFYGSSAYFDGNDFLHIANTNNCFQFSTNSFTVELWARPNSTSGDQYILSWECSGPNAGHAGINIYNGGWRIGGFNGQLYTGNTGLAAGKWVHIAWSKEGGYNRIFINGKIVSEFAANPNFTANTDLHLGAYASSGNPHKFVGYMQDFRVYKGVAKYTSDFNPPTIGDNAAAAGTDSLLDSPTNYEASSGNNGGNYCVLNPLAKTSTHTTSNGNLTSGTSSGGSACLGTMAFPKTGKWYYEAVFSSTPGYNHIGIATANCNTMTVLGANPGYDTANEFTYWQNGSKTNNVAYGASFTGGDVIGVAFDADAGSLVFYKNGVSQGTNATGLTGTYFPFIPGQSSFTTEVNFGQRPFSFPVSGYKTLCTQNLSDPTIADGSDYFDTRIYTGTGTTKSVSDLEFSPDFLWFKNRTDSSAAAHRLFDTVRGANKTLFSNLTNDELEVANSLTSFDSNGFTVGSGNWVNGNGDGIVAWAWDAGTSTVSNTDGSITSSVRANPSAGFSIITANWTSSGGTIGHGLNAVPEFIIAKNRDNTSNWPVWTTALGSGKGLILDGTLASYSNDYLASTLPTSSVITVRDFGSTSASDYIVYAFTSVAGYSAFGSYTGNGSADGPFVHTGFAPAFVMFKRSDSTGDWIIFDNKRNTHEGNYREKVLYPNKNNAEEDSANGDTMLFLSNGFKLNNVTFAYWNASGGDYLWAAFAEHPFKTARAR